MHENCSILSPRRVCSRGSSQTAHSLPTKVRSRRVRLRSVFIMPEFVPCLVRVFCDFRELIEADERCEGARSVPDAIERPVVAARQRSQRLSSLLGGKTKDKGSGYEIERITAWNNGSAAFGAGVNPPEGPCNNFGREKPTLLSLVRDGSDRFRCAARVRGPL